MDKEKIKKILTIENLLCFFIVICPLLDVSSFLFRDFFKTNFSISTIIRPIIPIFVVIYIFFKEKMKPQMFIASMAYFIYALCHLYIFYRIKSGCSYGNEIREIQYLINYTFMIMNLFIYIQIFFWKTNEKSKNDRILMLSKIKKAVLISLTIYIVLIYISLLTGTSTYTYSEEKIGYKGWFESGNSLGTIIILSLFMVLPMMKKENKTYIRIWAFMITVLSGGYLTTTIGTRTGLLGFCIVIASYIILNILYNLVQKGKLNKKVVIIGTIVFIVAGVTIIFVGSKTIDRRKQLKDKESEIYDYMLGEDSHVTGDTLAIVEKIKQGQMDEAYMPESMQRAYLDLYNQANKENVSNTNMRRLQFIYHSNLIKEQNNIPMLLFGNGYMTHYYEMIFEMEVPAFLYNFGVIGFFMYFMPFMTIGIYGTYIMIKKFKLSNIEFAMSILGLWFAIAISFLSGYTFFNSSSMMIIIALCVAIVYEIREISDCEIKIYNPEKQNRRN